MVIWGLEYCRLLALGLGWLEALQWRPPTLPTQPSRSVYLRVRQSGALRVLVALVRIILDLWAAPPQCGYWGSMGFFCSAPQDFGLLGFFCARFPPREASYIKTPLG